MVDPDTDDAKRVALAAIAGDPMFAAFHRTWEEKRGDRFAPRPSDMSASALAPSALSHIVIVDVIDGGARFHFRLVGTTIALSSGSDFTGKYADEALSGTVLATVLEQYRAIVARKRPAFATAEYQLAVGQTVKNSRLALPLSTDGVTVDRLILMVKASSDWLLRGDLRGPESSAAYETTRSFTLL